MTTTTGFEFLEEELRLFDQFDCTIETKADGTAQMSFKNKKDGEAGGCWALEHGTADRFLNAMTGEESTKSRSQNLGTVRAFLRRAKEKGTVPTLVAEITENINKGLDEHCEEFLWESTAQTTILFQ